MQSHEIRQRFLDFFEKRGHAVIPSASLVPENDPSVLFNTAGMQPLVPYLLGEKHPKGNRLVNAQKCVRTVDIEEVGDNTHLTFFEMLGNWSLGDYFKKEAIEWSYAFLTNKEEGLGLDPERLYVTVFEGNDDAPRDEESVAIWKSVGVPEHRIYFRDAEDNWWAPGENGPAGPSTEMFYDLTEEGLGDLSPEEFERADEEQQVVEIWNDVLMEYRQKDGKVVGKLEQKNIDTGAGLERVTAVVQGVKSAYETDLFEALMAEVKKHTNDTRRGRTIADHMRASVFLISDGVEPSNTDQGYVLRRLIRRAVMQTDARKLDTSAISVLVNGVVDVYGDFYTNVRKKGAQIKVVIEREVEQFASTLQAGLKQFEKASADGSLSGTEAFDLYQTHGFPIEMTEELAVEKGIEVDRAAFDEALKEHQEKSRTASAGKFKGGLGDTSEETVRYHTATHLLNAALREVLGEHVEQKGSNITAGRLRFDFSHPEKLTDEEKERITNWVQDVIAKNLPVTSEEMPIEKARELGALGVFGDKYDDVVRVYTVGDPDEPISREICGGPHVERTGGLGIFRIKKEQASSAGVRRIKAVLE